MNDADNASGLSMRLISLRLASKDRSYIYDILYVSMTACLRLTILCRAWT